MSNRKEVIGVTIDAKTKKIIDIANSNEFGDLCTGCQSGSDVIGTGRMLEHRGLIVKQIGKGGYVWKLAER